MAKFRQLKRQYASDVSQPTSLGVWDRFGGDYKQIERMLGHGRPAERIIPMERPALRILNETFLRASSYALSHAIALRSALHDRPAVLQEIPPANRDPDRPER